jgi:hypothetical protein
MAEKQKGDKFVDKGSGDTMTGTMTEIVPLRDFVLHSPPTVTRQVLKMGETAQVPTVFIGSLKAEKVI